MPEIREDGYVMSDDEVDARERGRRYAEAARRAVEARERQHREAMGMIGAAEAAMDMGEFSEASARALIAIALLVAEIAEH
jgi:uncharacterized protein HemY